MNFDFGAKIKEFRKARNLTQVQLSNLLNIQRSTVTHWENNMSNPSCETLKLIADITGRKITDFFEKKTDTNIVFIENYENNTSFEDKIGIDAKSLANIKDFSFLKYYEICSTDLEPEFYFGDVVILDMLKNREGFLKENGAYLVQVEDEDPTIRNVQFLPKNHLKLSLFDNDARKDFYPHQLDYKCAILGKVCGKISLFKGFEFK